MDTCHSLGVCAARGRRARKRRPLERGRRRMGRCSAGTRPPAALPPPLSRPTGSTAAICMFATSSSWAKCRVRTIRSKYVFPQTICWAPGQTAGLPPASDFLESAASGLAALLPRFLVRQLKSSNKLCLYRYRGMAGLPKHFQGALSSKGA